MTQALALRKRSVIHMPRMLFGSRRLTIEVHNLATAWPSDRPVRLRPARLHWIHREPAALHNYRPRFEPSGICSAVFFLRKSGLESSYFGRLERLGHIMRSSFVRVLLVAATMAPFTAACDDDSSSGSGPATSVPSDKVLSSLTDAELTQLNQDMGSYMQQQMSTSLDKDTMCQFNGVMAAVMMGGFDSSETPPTDASLQETCNVLATQCNQSSERPSTTGVGESTEISKTQLTDCNATVAEYQKCMQDSTKVSIDMMKGMPKCADLKAAELESLFTSSVAVEEPQSCEAMASKCPGYASDAG